MVRFLMRCAVGVWAMLFVSIVAAQESRPSESAPTSLPTDGPVGKIAFNRGGQIMLIDPQTMREETLVSDNVYDRPLVWTADGARLIFWNHAGGAWDLWAYDVAAKLRTNLTKSARDNRSAAPATRGGKIAFMRGGDGVWMMDADGKNPVQVDRRGHRDAAPVWSPSAQRLAFTDLNDAGSAGPMQAYVVELIDGRPTAAKHVGDGEVHFFLDEDHLVLTAPFEGAYEIVRLEISTGQRTPLTKSEGPDRNAVLSADRRRIAWEASGGDGRTLRIMNIDGAEKRSLARLEGTYAPPSFSPDSRYLAFESDRDQKGLNIFVISVHGGVAVPMTTTGGSFPVFRP